MKNKKNISGKIISSFYLLLIIYTQCCFGFDFYKCVEFYTEESACLITLNSITLGSPTIDQTMAIEIADKVSHFLRGKNRFVLIIKNLRFTPEAYMTMEKVF